MRGNIQCPQRSRQYGGLRPGLPLGAEKGASWMKAYCPQKSGQVEKLSLSRVAGCEAVKGERTET